MTLRTPTRDANSTALTNDALGCGEDGPFLTNQPKVSVIRTSQL